MKTYLRAIFTATVFLSIIFSVSAQKVVILHTNDMHSNLTGFGPESEYSPMYARNDNTKGGFARIAAKIYAEKQANPDATLVLDAGDFLMGTIFHTLENQTGFQLYLMSVMGYDAVTIGNHEFDFSPKFLAEAIVAAQKRGGTPDILASQFIFTPEKDFDDGLEELVKNKTIQPYKVIERQGIKFGIFGLIGDDAVSVAPGAAPLKFENMFKTAKRITKTLREVEKVDYVIYLSHSGVYPDKEEYMVGEDAELAKKVPGIDLILRGHTHIKTQQPKIVGKTLIVQTGAYGQFLGKLELDFSGSTVKHSYQLIPIDDKIEANGVVYKMIESYKSRVSEPFFAPLGLKYDTKLAETDTDLPTADYDTRNIGLMGQFVAEAVKFYTDSFSSGTDIVVVAGGTVRESILKGTITPADVFRIMPLGADSSAHPVSPLAKVWLTGREIKKLMEVALMSTTPGTDSYLYFSGILVHYNPDKVMLRKVEEIEINGKVIDISRNSSELYSITANTYLLSFIDKIKQMSKGLVKLTPKDENGKKIKNIYAYTLEYQTKELGKHKGKEWMAILEFLKSFKDTNGNGTPDVPKYLKYGGGCFVSTKPQAGI